MQDLNFILFETCINLRSTENRSGGVLFEAYAEQRYTGTRINMKLPKLFDYIFILTIIIFIIISYFFYFDVFRKS